ncbi:hypothetical protein OIDMADRAFT_143894 [Oidiodendron maius Zn]|uniref:Phosphoribulokinase/uridine kinase domain-containing protein n=1 Tax=Oidiodendron maius (strain Zn) TaxID=913774 RepID=A0A0C3HJV1_OIDMZ|nr:hypothetical protein OIDMADRAFT_143894 [Oidiodendron maius Zn]
MSERKAIVVAISGCSSSGKTTLSRLLRDMFPDAFVLHADDFYRPEAELPLSHGMVDWDCAEALSIPDMIKSLTHIHEQGTFPPFLDSKEDQNEIGPCPVSPSQITSLYSLVHTWSSMHRTPRICIFDGFLLYPDVMAALQPHLDIKIFLRTTKAKALARRAARSGYVTLEGFWEDPPGYVEKIVWPNYVRDHRFLFKDGDVEGEIDKEVAMERGIEYMQGGADEDMEMVLKWAVEALMGKLPNVGGEGVVGVAT